jgi:hypothetical protein
LDVRLGDICPQRLAAPGATPIAALTGLRHLTLVDPAWNEDPMADRYNPDLIEQEEGALQCLTALTGLEVLHVDLDWTVHDLPPLPALRTLRARHAVVSPAQLHAMPLLTELTAKEFGVSGFAGGPIDAGLVPHTSLQRASLGGIIGLPTLAPNLRHLHFILWGRLREELEHALHCDVDRVNAWTPLSRLEPLHQLRSLAVSASTPGLGGDDPLQAAMLARCTELVLHDFVFDAALLPVCRAVSSLGLVVGYGGQEGWDEARVRPWLAGMRDSSVRELTLRGEEAWVGPVLPLLRPLGAWRSLQRLVIHCSELPGGTLRQFAEECAATGSPLARIELCHVASLTESDDGAWLRGRDAVCAAVERANPRITCTAGEGRPYRGGGYY